jgi:hypothetical protein
VRESRDRSGGISVSREAVHFGFFFAYWMDFLDRKENTVIFWTCEISSTFLCSITVSDRF